ncbi:hypothetical protein [Prevotella pallens]|uniref:hypothetical protein n=1 Tax=Prevotella pallens TaxID=60133 RepID=UPI001CB0269B|nr:hypothetical protein [Prevotella pallens]MBF1463912.1 hypothetical protein [Prevotella pallens]
MKQIGILLAFLLTTIVAQSHEQQYIRLKGYYRVYQSTNFMLSYFVDGMMELYVPLDTTSKKTTFVDRKFLGERRRKAKQANGDETFVRINMPALESTPLIESIKSEEYSTRNNGDVYRWADKCGTISKHKFPNQKIATTGITINMDNLMGQENHEIEMNQLKMYGIIARMTQFDEQETYVEHTGTYTLKDLYSAHKHQTFMAHYKGEDTDEQIDVWSDLFITDRAIISESEMKKIKKEKPRTLTFEIPSSVPQLDNNILQAWLQMVEY